MRIGVGLPSVIPGAPGELILDWARGAEAAGFSSLATIDRIAYTNFDSLVTLAAAGAVTERIGLKTNILLGPLYNPVLLAKEAASIDRVSGGRLALGLAVGGRRDDFDIVGAGFEDRGRRLDAIVETMLDVWRPDHPVGPKPHAGDRVRLVFGGMSDAAVRRTVRWGSGWTAGGSGADRVAPFAERVRTAWADAGRDGSPTIHALAYFGLGDEARSSRYILDYYAYAGEHAGTIDGAVLRSPGGLTDAVARFEDAGVDELFLDPTIADLSELDRLGDAVL